MVSLQGDSRVVFWSGGDRYLFTILTLLLIMPVRECSPEEAREKLAAAGASFEPGNSKYEQWRAELDDAIAVAYDDKVVIQGTNPIAIDAVLREDTGGRCHLYFDGASRGNPGPAAIGWVIVTDAGIVATGNDTIGRATNNQAEYAALLAGVKAARNYGYDEINIRGDSELIVKQVTGEWNTNDPVLQEERVNVRAVLDSFDEWSISHVPRELNEKANKLANEALDAS